MNVGDIVATNYSHGNSNFCRSIFQSLTDDFIGLMRTSDPTSIVSRYACLDFAEHPGFPNRLPSDEYLLRNGPKFNGEDLSLAVKHISNFCQFTELLRVKHEDVFIRLFYDSLQGKCKIWVKDLSIGSIRSLTDFWIIFLNTWMEKTKFRAYSLSIKILGNGMI